MKKFLALTMALILIFSLILVSCDKAVIDEDALESLEEINESVKDAVEDIKSDDNNLSNGAVSSKLKGKTPRELYVEAVNKINFMLFN